MGPNVAGNRLLCTEYQLAQGSNDVPAFSTVRAGCHRLPWSTAEDSQVRSLFTCVLTVTQKFVFYTVSQK